jgi:hypothetical protein
MLEPSAYQGLFETKRICRKARKDTENGGPVDKEVIGISDIEVRNFDCSRAVVKSAALGDHCLSEICVSQSIDKPVIAWPRSVWWEPPLKRRRCRYTERP